MRAGGCENDLVDDTRAEPLFTGFRATGPLPPRPGVSYVMPVLNEATHLARAVAAVLGQDYDGQAEIILALATSTDDTDRIAAELAASDERVRLVPNPRDSIPSGLNLAIQASRHPVVIRVDAHSELPDGYTAAAVDALRRTGAGNVGGVMVARGEGLVQRAIARAYNSPFGLGGGVFHHGETEQSADSAYLGVFRREVLDEVGGYDETIWRAEDWELNSRIRQAGYLVLFTPSLRVTYWPRTGLAALSRQMYATGVWRGHLTRRNGSAPLRYLPAPIVALIFAASLVGALSRALGLLGARGSRLANLANAGAGAYLAGIAAVGVAKLGGDKPVDRLLNIAVLAVIHLSWGTGFCRGYVRGAGATLDRSRV